MEVIAAQAPDLPEVLAQGREAGWALLALDGTLNETPSSRKSQAGHDIWYSDKHHHRASRSVGEVDGHVRPGRGDTVITRHQTY